VIIVAYMDTTPVLHMHSNISNIVPPQVKNCSSYSLSWSRNKVQIESLCSAVYCNSSWWHTNIE